MDAKELRAKSPEEVQRLISQWREEMRNLRFKIATRQFTKVRALRLLKKDLARALSVLRSSSHV